MTPLVSSRIESNLLSRSLRASWFLAFALAGLLAPQHPHAALSILAGQLLGASNFFFLDRLVKLFTRAALPRAMDASGRPAPQPLPGSFFGWAVLKVALVYGGAFVLIRTQAVEFLPLVGGLSLPLLALLLKAFSMALGFAGPSRDSRRATQTAAISGNAAKLAAFFFVLALASAPSIVTAQTPHETPPPATTQTHDAGQEAVKGDAAPGDPAAVHTAPDAAGSGAHVSPPGEEHGTAAGAAGAHGESSGAQHLPNWVTILNDYFPDSPLVHWMHENEYLVFAWLAGIICLVVIWIAMRDPSPVPGHLQNAIEWIVESMQDVAGGMLGKHLPKYFPFIMAIFFYILTMNLIGIIPGLKSSTSTLDVTLALALVTFLYVQVNGIINLGPLGYLDHLAGSPRDVVGFAMLPVMIPVHILGELVKPVSLSCRLFGNIFGEDTLIVVFVGVAALALKASLVALAVPPMAGITALFMMLQTLTAIVQALIFSLLTTVYLYMMLPHESHGEHAHGEAGH
ncbi:MAG TPA: F0F1 ATP synthase subunit A [Candidatus Eisenbacteria bacterium]|nr:F0F1 ATP synthase subunit A [Candidatus Eisenbacteria bacterium]